MNITQIKNLYSEKYSFELFYELAQTLLEENQFIPKASLSNGGKAVIEGSIIARPGDIRVDLPIWFGDVSSKNRIIFLGLEPRDTEAKYNIEKKDNFIFATPFGIEFWNEKNKYFKSFKSVLKPNDLFVYFTDVVKHYEVKSTKNKSDINARALFWEKAVLEENLEFLNQELNLINPTHVIALGGDSFKFLNHHFGEKWNVVKVIHPAARPDKKTGMNAYEKVNETLGKILKSF